jgi:hypothetical protein
MKSRGFIKAIIFFFTFGTTILTDCGVYTFNGSTLPSYLKTVDIPLFENQSLQPNIAEEVTKELNRQVLSGNLLRIVSTDGDATVSGTITSYSNDPYTFGAADTRQIDVESYIVKIGANVLFFDNKNNRELYKGAVTGEGIYNFKTETETIGRQRAEKDLVQRILQSSVQSW